MATTWHGQKSSVTTGVMSGEVPKTPLTGMRCDIGSGFGHRRSPRAGYPRRVASPPEDAPRRKTRQSDAGSIRVVTAIRFQALMVKITAISWASSASSKCSAARW